MEAACKAHANIKDILHPRRDNRKGYKDPRVDLLLRSWLEGMQRFLWTYTNINARLYNKWMVASLEATESVEWGWWYVRCLWEWSCAFIEGDENLPFNVYGTWNKSWLDNEDLKQELLTHLQSINWKVYLRDGSGLIYGLLGCSKASQLEKRHIGAHCKILAQPHGF